MTETLENLFAEAVRESKPQTILISDPAKIAEITSRGKCRDRLPFWTRLGTSILLYKDSK